MQTIARSPVFITSLVIGLVFAVSEGVAGGSLGRIVLSGAIPIAYGLIVTLIGRRSETVSVLAGRPVDERWQHINLEASTWALGVSAIAVLAAFVMAQATGGEWQPYALIAAVMALAYVGALVLLRLRG